MEMYRLGTVQVLKVLILHGLLPAMRAVPSVVVTEALRCVTTAQLWGCPGQGDMLPCRLSGTRQCVGRGQECAWELRREGRSGSGVEGLG